MKHDFFEFKGNDESMTGSESSQGQLSARIVIFTIFHTFSADCYLHNSYNDLC